MRFLLILTIVAFTFSANAQEAVDASIKVCVAGKCKSGDLLRKDILRSAGVLLLDEEKNKIEALSFGMVFSISGKTTTYHNEGYMFTSGCKEYIAKLHVGDSFQVQSIVYKNADDKEVHAEDRRYSIVAGR